MFTSFPTKQVTKNDLELLQSTIKKGSLLSPFDF